MRYYPTKHHVVGAVALLTLIVIVFGYAAAHPQPATVTQKQQPTIAVPTPTKTPTPSLTAPTAGQSATLTPRVITYPTHRYYYPTPTTPLTPPLK